MKFSFLSVVILCVIGVAFIPVTQAQIAAVLNIFKTGFDIFKTGFQIVNFLKQQGSGSTEDTKRQLESLRQDLEQMIQSSTTQIIREITLQNKLDKIEDVVINIQSLLIDMKHYILADNAEDKANYKSLFLSRFDQGVVSMIRNLPNFLSYNILGYSEPLLDLIRKKSSCNMTAIYDFHLFYANLLSDGATLQFVFRELSNITSEDVSEFWLEKLPGVQKQFDNTETTCKSKMPEYAAVEVKHSIDAVDLHKNCKQRYTWAWCDVFYYPPMGTHQFHYQKSVPDFLFWNRASSSRRNQVLVIGDKSETVQSWNKNSMAIALASNMETFRSAISGSEDSSAALKVGKAVEEFVKEKGFLMKGIAVFFYAATLGQISLELDEDSPVVHFTVEGVTLKYCYNSGFACTFARWDKFNFNDDWKTYSGNFHVYVFPCSTSDVSQNVRPDCFQYSTSSARVIYRMSLTTYIIILITIMVFYNL